MEDITGRLLLEKHVSRWLLDPHREFWERGRELLLEFVGLFLGQCPSGRGGPSDCHEWQGFELIARSRYYLDFSGKFLHDNYSQASRRLGPQLHLGNDVLFYAHDVQSSRDLRGLCSLVWPFET
jgi:hypothetical protein